MIGRQPRLEHLPQPQHDVGALGAIGGRLLDADGVERDFGLAGLDQGREVERGVIEGVLGEGRKRVAHAAGIERVRHQHGVVVAGHRDAAQRQELPGEFQIVADLDDAPVLEQRLQRVERRALGQLVGREIAAEQAAGLALAALAMAERHIAGLVRRDRERETAQLGPHRIGADGRGIDGEKAELPRARNPDFELLDAAHGLVFGAVEFGAARGLDARGREAGGGERGVGDNFPSLLAGNVGRLRRPVERKLRRG